MATVRAARSRRRHNDLLNAYALKFGDVLRQHHSGVALRAAKVEAELAYQARGSFLASMNHELRTPLNAITGFTGLLKQADEMGFSDEQRAEYLDYILESAELLLSHINTILEIADAESGGTKLARRAVDIGDVIHQIIDGMAHDESQSVVFAEDFGDALPPVDVDPDKIAAAFRHLIEFLAEPGEMLRIKVSTRRGLAGQSANSVYVAIDAPDASVDEADVDEALRVFDQVHEGLYRRIDQRRLGLPIAKSYIELNQGRFTIRAKEGEGARIRFSLPIAAEEYQSTYEQLAS